MSKSAVVKKLRHTSVMLDCFRFGDWPKVSALNALSEVNRARHICDVSFPQRRACRF